MTIKQAISEAVQLFKKQQYSEAIEKLNSALDRITDKSQYIQEQLYIQHWLGRCYLEHALKTNDIQQANSLFEKAIEHYSKKLQLATTENNIQQQLNAYSWLGLCYLEQAIKTNNIQQANSLFEKAIEYHSKKLQLATTENNIQQQLNAYGWLGRSYLEYAIKTNDNDIKLASSIFDKAVECFTESLKLAKKLTTENNVQEQFYTQYWLGRCYFEQTLKANDNEKTTPPFKQAIEQFEACLISVNQLENKAEAQLNINYWLGCCYSEQSPKKDFKQKKNPFNDYFDCKKEQIRQALSSLFKNNSENNEIDLKDEICTILTVLNIHPVEIRNIPLAHYTNPNVGEILFSLNNKKGDPNNKMRMNSATYMNDPTEGKSLLELLGKPEISLENRTEFGKRSAFFSCFSSRVNDLNQFRLYGKEDNVEASGCCIVFNKQGNWLKQPNISLSFTRNLDVDNTESINSANPTNTLNSQELPLYQVAYIIYVDEYLKCHINDDNTLANQKFAIFLPPIGNERYQKNWHKKREYELINALNQLTDKLKEIDSLSLEQKQDLEYILYLFKDFAFRDEEEFRLLRIVDFDPTKIDCCENTNSLFVEYDDISGMVDEVILGTNYEKTEQKRKVEVFRHKMQKKFPHIKITHSSLPINSPH